MIEVGWEQLRRLCVDAVSNCGGDVRTARALAAAVLAAERRGNTSLGVAHLFDYLEALTGGRLNGSPEPVLSHDRASVITVAADDGAAQVAFDLAFEEVVEAARHTGVSVLSISNAFTVGELGLYTAAVASEGLLALAGANSSALMSLYDAPAVLTGTNPFSFAIPAEPTPRMIDQASSVTAWVRIREAAEAGRPIPLGWALDAQGNPTTDAAAALRGPILPFGGPKGSNIALIIELLSVLSGAAFSIDGGKFDSGGSPPRVGLFLVALDSTAFASDYLQRAEQHFERLKSGYGIDFGRFIAPVETLQLAEDTFTRLVAIASGNSDSSSPDV